MSYSGFSLNLLISCSVSHPSAHHPSFNQTSWSQDTRWCFKDMIQYSVSTGNNILERLFKAANVKCLKFNFTDDLSLI